MLVIQMPPGKETARRKRQIRGALYLLPGPILVTAVFLAPDLWIMAIALLAEWWWCWAVFTDPVLGNR